MKLTISVNFINILRANFLYQSALSSFSLVTFWLCDLKKAAQLTFVRQKITKQCFRFEIFLCQNIGKKTCVKCWWNWLQFGTNPKLFLSAIQKLTKESPVLLKLLGLSDCDEETPRPVTSDRASQTATHPVDKVNNHVLKNILKGHPNNTWQFFCRF